MIVDYRLWQTTSSVHCSYRLPIGTVVPQRKVCYFGWIICHNSCGCIMQAPTFHRNRHACQWQATFLVFNGYFIDLDLGSFPWSWQLHVRHQHNSKLMAASQLTTTRLLVITTAASPCAHHLKSSLSRTSNTTPDRLLCTHLCTGCRTGL